MYRIPKRTPAAPDGGPKTSSQGRGASSKSRISQVDDPLISGDAGGREGAKNTDEAAVDEAGQIRKKQSPVDLLH